MQYAPVIELRDLRQPSEVETLEIVIGDPSEPICSISLEVLAKWLRQVEQPLRALTTFPVDTHIHIGPGISVPRGPARLRKLAPGQSLRLRAVTINVHLGQFRVLREQLHGGGALGALSVCRLVLQGRRPGRSLCGPM